MPNEAATGAPLGKRSHTGSRESGKILRSFLFLTILILVGLVAVQGLMWGYFIKPGEMGVRRIGFGPNKGYVETALEPGFHWGMPLLNYSTVTVVPSKVQLLHFNRFKQDDGVTLPSIEISTDDRAEILADVSLFVRFYGGPGTTSLLANPASGSDPEQFEVEHGGPADLLENLTTNPSSWYRRIRESAADELLRALKSVPSEEFYNPSIRDAKVREATVNMNKRLAQFGIAVEHVLLRRYTYRSEQINTAIYRKNLQEQEERLNAKLVELEKEKKRQTELIANYDAKKKTALVSGESEAVKLRSEAELEYAKLVAQGDAARDQATAEIQELKASALSGVEGAEVFIAMETAPVVSALRGGIVQGVDPFDLDAWAELLGAEKVGGR